MSERKRAVEKTLDSKYEENPVFHLHLDDAEAALEERLKPILAAWVKEFKDENKGVKASDLKNVLEAVTINTTL